MKTIIAFALIPLAAAAQAPPKSPTATVSPIREDASLEWPLPRVEQAYGRIDGRHLHRYVEEQAAISRRYRDQGHPKFWGRIIGTSADAENGSGLADKIKTSGAGGGRTQAVTP